MSHSPAQSPEPFEPAQLTGAQRRKLRGLAHSLEPVVALGRAGLTEGVFGELDRALDRHELIKVRLSGERGERAESASAIAHRLGCAVAGTIGHVAILYRRQADPERRRIAL